MLTRFLASCPFMIKLVVVHAQAFFAFIARQSGPFGLEEIASSLSHSPSQFDFLLFAQHIRHSFSFSTRPQRPQGMLPFYHVKFSNFAAALTYGCERPLSFFLSKSVRCQYTLIHTVVGVRSLIFTDLSYL
ncbi:hypothetical protein SETIT_7G201300v2 [Setaria italica]|uniref:Secreted protein n=1 Tax=Setaria italica TaxID=4555 RepID=A0A368RZH3_SETIT|nr:hypothetical protein SETIT_7G201300v2 [Setaria italica]